MLVGTACCALASSEIEKLSDAPVDAVTLKKAYTAGFKDGAADEEVKRKAAAVAKAAKEKAASATKLAAPSSTPSDPTAKMSCPSYTSSDAAYVDTTPPGRSNFTKSSSCGTILFHTQECTCRAPDGTPSLACKHKGQNSGILSDFTAQLQQKGKQEWCLDALKSIQQDYNDVYMAARMQSAAKFYTASEGTGLAATWNAELDDLIVKIRKIVAENSQPVATVNLITNETKRYSDYTKAELKTMRTNANKVKPLAQALADEMCLAKSESSTLTPPAPVQNWSTPQNHVDALDGKFAWYHHCRPYRPQGPGSLGVLEQLFKEELQKHLKNRRGKPLEFSFKHLSADPTACDISARDAKEHVFVVRKREEGRSTCMMYPLTLCVRVKVTRATNANQTSGNLIAGWGEVHPPACSEQKKARIKLTGILSKELTWIPERPGRGSISQIRSTMQQCASAVSKADGAFRLAVSKLRFQVAEHLLKGTWFCMTDPWPKETCPHNISLAERPAKSIHSKCWWKPKRTRVGGKLGPKTCPCFSLESEQSEGSEGISPSIEGEDNSF